MVNRTIASPDDVKYGGLVPQDDVDVLARIPTGRGAPVGSFHRVLTGKTRVHQGLKGLVRRSIF